MLRANLKIKIFTRWYYLITYIKSIAPRTQCLYLNRINWWTMIFITPNVSRQREEKSLRPQPYIIYKYAFVYTRYDFKIIIILLLMWYCDDTWEKKQTPNGLRTKILYIIGGIVVIREYGRLSLSPEESEDLC